MGHEMQSHVIIFAAEKCQDDMALEVSSLQFMIAVLG